MDDRSLVSGVVALIVLRRNRMVGFLCLIGMLVALFGHSVVLYAEGEPLPEWRLRPYEIQIQLDTAFNTTVSATLQEKWKSQFHELITSRFRNQWKVEFLDGEAPNSNRFDKVFRIHLSQQGGVLELSGSEWDRCSDTSLSVPTKRVLEQRAVPFEMADLLMEAFRPLVRLDSADGTRITGELRAGEFGNVERFGSSELESAVFVPFARVLNKRGELHVLSRIPWSYLECQQIERADCTFQLVSSFQQPIPIGRRRVEAYALLQPPQQVALEILVYPRGSRQNSLIGLRCLLTSPPTENSEEVLSPIELATDRRGIVTIPADGTHSIRQLTLYSGAAVLARVPVFPTGASRVDLEVPDDSARLNIEGAVSRLEGELVDLVATREVLITRAQAAMEQKRWEAVEEFAEQLKKIPTQEQFLYAIDQLELQGTQAAKDAKDRVAEQRIRKLCLSIRESAVRFLETSRIPDVLDEINKERSQQ
ncbi:hypothetical protein SH668x_001378 [Planctomicrobium sp. SH668]|uniref:hypothetical protein n=1 Tax=Planctomicrobium sp. SH668 TaxID=3448126 RepID=UPI003F5C40DF